jgi:hypothetical protein
MPNIDFSHLFKVDDDMAVNSTGPIGVGAIRTPAMDEARIRAVQERLSKATPPNLSLEASMVFRLNESDGVTSTAKDLALEKVTAALDGKCNRATSEGDWGSDIGPLAKSDVARSDMEPESKPHADGLFPEQDRLGKWIHAYKGGALVASRVIDPDDGQTYYFDSNGDECCETDVASCFAVA